MPGKVYLAKLHAAGFRSGLLIGPTGVTTSRYTAAWHVAAMR